jgi:hypothetical protein
MEEKKKPEVDNDKVKRSLTIIGLNYVAGLFWLFLPMDRLTSKTI